MQRACARIHTHVRKRVDGLFVSRELENAFQRISRDASVLETRLFVEKRELLCYGFYTLSAPVSFEFVSTELCTSFSLDVGILMTERGLILFSFCSTIRFVDYLEINYKLNYYLENARCIIGNIVLKKGYIDTERRRINCSLKIIILFNYLNEQRKRIIFDVLNKKISHNPEKILFILHLILFLREIIIFFNMNILFIKKRFFYLKYLIS